MNCMKSTLWPKPLGIEITQFAIDQARATPRDQQKTLTHAVLEIAENPDLKIDDLYRNDSETFDMNAELHYFLDLLKQQSFKDMNNEERRNFDKAFTIRARHLTEQMEASVATPKMVDSDIAQTFARGAGIVILFVEGSGMVEDLSLVLVLGRAAFAGKIKAIVLVRDTKPLRAQVRSDGKKVDEFATRLTRPLMSRLENNHFQ